MGKKYYIKNKHKGVKMAKYNQQKEQLKKMKERRSAEADRLEAKIAEEQRCITELEADKAQAICAGDQNEFLTVAEELRKSKDNLEYYQERKKKAAELFKIKSEELIEFVNNTKQEQERLNTDAIKWLKEQTKGIFYVLDEIKNELDEGDRINGKALNLYLKDASPAEARVTQKNLPGYDESQHRFNFYHTNGALERYTEKLQKLIDYFDSNEMMQYFEELYTETLS